MATQEPTATSSKQPVDVLDSPGAGPAAMRGGIMRSGAYVLGVLLSLVSAPLLIRHLGKIEYGHYITVVALVSIVIGLSEGGVNAVALRNYTTRSGAERDRLMANVLGVRMMLSALGLLVAVAFALIAGYSGELVLGALLMGVGVVMQVTQDLLDVSLQATLRFGLVTFAEFLRQFIAVALVIALVILGAHLLSFFVVTIPAGIVGVALSMWLVRGMFPRRPSFHLGVVWPLLRETALVGVSIALNAVYFRLTVIVMSLAASAAQTGYFAISFRVVEVMIGVPALFMGAAFPILTRAQRDDRERFANAARRMFELAALVGIWIAVCLELGAGFIVEVLTGHRGDPAAAVLRIQGLAVMFTFVSVACAYPLLSLHRQRDLVVANLLGVVVALVLSLTLIPALGAEGGALTTVGAEVTLALASILALVRASPGLRLPLGIAPVALAAAAVAIVLARVLGGGSLVETLVGAPTFLVVIFALGRFPPELGHLLQGLGRSSAREAQ